MSDTPRTDRERRRIVRSKTCPSAPVDSEFARELERELATAREALEWARMQLGKHTRPSPIDKALESLNKPKP